MKLLQQYKLKAGVTGTREGWTAQQTIAVTELLQGLHVYQLHHGDCIGSDASFHALAYSLLIPHIYIHPPLEDRYRAHCEEIPAPKTVSVHTLPALDYLHRDYRIVQRAPDILIATPKTAQEVTRSGTWATVRYARKRGVRFRYIVEPSGHVRRD